MTTTPAATRLAGGMGPATHERYIGPVRMPDRF